jgi:predicted nucleotidyltransferase component of viral defense system
MDTNVTKLNWHRETLPKKTREALDYLSGEEWLGKSGWYLAGGTALALQAGHRKSYDLDFFTEQKNFDEKKLLGRLLSSNNWKASIEEKNTIFGELLETKVSFIAYPFFVPGQELIQYGSIHVLNKTDIAVMKITAISQRGKKRDFFDLYWCARNIEPLEDIIRRLKVQYPAIAHDYHHILKALVYFEDAENDPEPIIYFDANWRKVKKFFEEEIPRIAEKLIR